MEDSDYYFNAFIRESIKDLEKIHECYVYNKEQVHEILKVFPKAIIKNEKDYILIKV